jgi:hypothetical protein
MKTSKIDGSALEAQVFIHPRRHKHIWLERSGPIQYTPGHGKQNANQIIRFFLVTVKGQVKHYNFFQTTSHASGFLHMRKLHTATRRNFAKICWVTVGITPPRTVDLVLSIPRLRTRLKVAWRMEIIITMS